MRFNAAFAMLVRFGAVIPATASTSAENTQNIARVTLGDHVYDIPSNYGSYVTSGIDTPKVGYGGFKFEVLLPDFTPRTASNSAQLDAVGWHDQVRGIIEAFPKSQKQIDNKTVLSNFLAQPWFSGVIPVSSHGYRIYTPRLKSFNDLRAKNLPNGDVLVMQCSQDWGLVVFPDCTVYEHWQGLSMIYSFSRKYAEQGDSIDQKVRNMMLSFREK